FTISAFGNRSPHVRSTRQAIRGSSREGVMAKRRVWVARDKILYTLAAAYLSSKGDKQTDIAAKLEVNQSEVSRMLQEAIKRNWLKMANPVFSPTKDVEALWQAAQAKFAKFLSSNDLLQQLKELEGEEARLRAVTVVRGSAG